MILGFLDTNNKKYFTSPSKKELLGNYKKDLQASPVGGDYKQHLRYI